MKNTKIPRHLYQPPGGESLGELEHRAAQFLKPLLLQHEFQTVLVIAHAGTNRMLLRLILNKPFDEWLSIEQDNACLNIIEISSDSSEQKVNQELLNCTAHLSSVGLNQLGVFE